jgi:hypothetical protein
MYMDISIYTMPIVVQNMLFLSSDVDFFHCFIEQIDEVPLDSDGYQELNVHPYGIEISRSILVSIVAHRTISNSRIA